MTEFQAGDAVTYLRPRKQPDSDGDWWERIPARYVCKAPWGRCMRHKITWRTEEGWEHRYVNVLSITPAQTVTDSPNLTGDKR